MSQQIAAWLSSWDEFVIGERFAVTWVYGRLSGHLIFSFYWCQRTTKSDLGVVSRTNTDGRASRQLSDFHQAGRRRLT